MRMWVTGAPPHEDLPQQKQLVATQAILDTGSCSYTQAEQAIWLPGTCGDFGVFRAKEDSS